MKYIKFISISVILIFYNLTWVKSQGVVDAHIISERGFYFNVIPNPYDNGFHYYPNDFNDEEKKIIRDIESGNRYTPFDFLLHEDENWVIRTWYQIDLDMEENKIFKKDVIFWLRSKSDSLNKTVYYKERGDSTQLIDTIYKYMKTGEFTLYKDYKFSKVIEPLDININQADSVTHLRLMIDWNYDKKTGLFENYIVGFGLFSITNDREKCFGYLYYPQLRILLRYYFPGISKPSYNDFFQNRDYKAEFIGKVKLYQNTFYDYETRFEKGYYEDRTELEPLLDIELLKDEWKYQADSVFSGKISFRNVQGETIMGGVLGRFMEGNWIWKFNSGKIKLDMNFKSGIPHGDFISYWENGKVREKGKFEFGKRTGSWSSYNESGILIAKRNYLNGWMSGKQETFYFNGNKHLIYHYKNHLVEGKYENYYQSGTLMASGYLEKAIMKGNWKFNIEIDDEFIELNGKIRKEYPKVSDEVLKDMIISFEADYIHGFNKFLPYGGLDLELKVSEIK